MSYRFLLGEFRYLDPLQDLGSDHIVRRSQRGPTSHTSRLLFRYSQSFVVYLSSVMSLPGIVRHKGFRRVNTWKFGRSSRYRVDRG